jgi:hypothetical protein
MATNILRTIFPCFTGEDQYYDEIKIADDEPARLEPSEKVVFGGPFKSSSIARSCETSGDIPRSARPYSDNKFTDIDEEQLANDILSLLYKAEDLDALRKEVRATGWTDALARRILDGLVNALNAGAAMGGPMKEAFDKASAEAKKFVEEHPILTAVIVTLIAIGILEIMVPWAVAALGFGELGPIEGSNSPKHC